MQSTVLSMASTSHHEAIRNIYNVRPSDVLSRATVGQSRQLRSLPRTVSEYSLASLKIILYIFHLPVYCL